MRQGAGRRQPPASQANAPSDDAAQQRNEVEPAHRPPLWLESSIVRRGRLGYAGSMQIKTTLQPRLSGRLRDRGHRRERPRDEDPRRSGPPDHAAVFSATARVATSSASTTRIESPRRCCDGAGSFEPVSWDDALDLVAETNATDPRRVRSAPRSSTIAAAVRSGLMKHVDRLTSSNASGR